MPINKTNGKFHKEDNGSWTIDTKIKVNDNWVHLKKRGYKTLNEAKADFRNIANECYEKKLLKSNSDITFIKVYEEYKEYRSFIVNFTSLEKDESLFNCHILNEFKDLPIKTAITQDKINKWYVNLCNENLSNNRKQSIISKFKDFIKYSYNHKYIEPGAYQDCDIILHSIPNDKKPKTEKIIWNDDEEKRFLDVIQTQGNEKDYLYFSILINTGLRIGEFLGLQGKSFDYANKKLLINQQVVNKDGDGWYLTTKLKTNESYRNVVLPIKLAEELNQFIINFNIEDDDFVIFATNKKKPMSRTEFKRKLHKYCELAQVTQISPHSFRHRHAVKLSKVCVTMDNITNAAKRLGHSPSMFSNTYANHINEFKQAELLDKMFDK